MVTAPNALSPRVAPYSDDQATRVIPRVVTAVKKAPRLLVPFLLIMVPTLVVALVAGGLVGQPLAPVAGAAIGVFGAAVALWFAIRQADQQ